MRRSLISLPIFLLTLNAYAFPPNEIACKINEDIYVTCHYASQILGYYDRNAKIVQKRAKVTLSDAKESADPTRSFRCETNEDLLTVTMDHSGKGSGSFVSVETDYQAIELSCNYISR